MYWSEKWLVEKSVKFAFPNFSKRLEITKQSLSEQFLGCSNDLDTIIINYPLVQ